MFIRLSDDVVYFLLYVVVLVCVFECRCFAFFFEEGVVFEKFHGCNYVEYWFCPSTDDGVCNFLHVVFDVLNGALWSVVVDAFGVIVWPVEFYCDIWCACHNICVLG